MNFKAFLVLFLMMYNVHAFSEKLFLLLWEPMTSYHVTNVHKIFWYLCFFSTLLCQEKESTKHLLVTKIPKDPHY